MKKHFIYSICLFFISACTNDFEKYYDGYSIDEITQKFPLSNPIQTNLYRSFEDNRWQDERELVSEGYTSIGTSSFNGAEANSEDALKWGQKLNADIVMYYATYTHTVHSMNAVSLPDFSSSNTNYYNSYGRSIGSSVTNTSGFSTAYIPTETRRYNYTATYWKKDNKKIKLGVYVWNLPERKKQELKTNKGVIIDVIVKNSPAYYNDILRGDIIQKINGKTVFDAQSFMSIMEDIPDNSTINIQLIRDNKTLTKKFKVN